MLPQVRLISRLKSIDAVTVIVGQEIRAEIVPGLEHYPALVMSVLSNVPQNSAIDGSSDFTMRLRLSALDSRGSPGLRPGVGAVMAVAGDAQADGGPTGINGWIDAEKSLWKLEDMFDEAGQIESGTDTFMPSL